MSRTAREARAHQRAYRRIMDEAWNNPAPAFDPHGDQRSYEPELAAAHLASLSDERRAELNEGWTNA